MKRDDRFITVILTVFFLSQQKHKFESTTLTHCFQRYISRRVCFLWWLTDRVRETLSDNGTGMKLCVQSYLFKTQATVQFHSTDRSKVVIQISFDLCMVLRWHTAGLSHAHMSWLANYNLKVWLASIWLAMCSSFDGRCTVKKIRKF